jgi:hypothetical protein
MPFYQEKPVAGGGLRQHEPRGGNGYAFHAVDTFGPIAPIPTKTFT